MIMKQTLHPIQNEADYRVALAQVEKMVDAPTEPNPESDEGAHLDALVTLIQAWEEKHYPIAPPDPVSAIEEAERIYLDEEQSRFMLDLLDNPPPPNAKLLAAAQRAKITAPR